MDKIKNIYGLIGEKLSHSFSPFIHNEILKRVGLAGEYNLYEVDRENLKSKILNLKKYVKGLNVTIPYKVDVIDFLDEVSDEVKKIGAVNTISFLDELIIGYNTDYFGFGIMLDINKIDVKNKKAVILGTGGAAKSVVHYLIDNEISDVILVSRDKVFAQEKFKEIKCIDYDELDKVRSYDLIINCTPCGMYPNIDVSPVNKDILTNFSIAIDLIYNPRKTLYLKWAEELGLISINGLYMLIAQAVKSQEIWNSINIDFKVIDDIYDIISKEQ
ncbi:shikimate dehydrogenase [Thermobrachium celere]|uniref:Shikimate dehydrogenase (NADP(+)) n=1 Tax=Thermobrachium celere DSM 8682 TaxID=941824 RepID=R7RNC5_9CLOT|nr:Shikimate 5-dehydrogenase I alpha [Thermobrachium celere DSM 8682]